MRMVGGLRNECGTPLVCGAREMTVGRAKNGKTLVGGRRKDFGRPRREYVSHGGRTCEYAGGEETAVGGLRKDLGVPRRLYVSHSNGP